MIRFLKQLILEAGKICKNEQAKVQDIELEYKNKKDLVTHVDKKVENFIVNSVQKQFPDHGFYGEETGQSNIDAEYLWIIDPIDGTTSFVHHHPFYCISIAVYHHGKAAISAVYAPELNELFTADHSGAFLNGQAIRVSNTGKWIESVMATGFACLRADLKTNNLPIFNRIAPKLRDIRRFGSAALDLCYVACGRLDGFWEFNLNPYDTAAGTFIVEKAGGIISDFNGKDNTPSDGIIAANPFIYDQLLNEIKSAANPQ